MWPLMMKVYSRENILYKTLISVGAFHHDFAELDTSVIVIIEQFLDHMNFIGMHCFFNNLRAVDNFLGTFHLKF